MKCPECKGEMKALFSSWYCPQDCDKPEVLAKRKAEKQANCPHQYYPHLSLDQYTCSWCGKTISGEEHVALVAKTTTKPYVLHYFGPGVIGTSQVPLKIPGTTTTPPDYAALNKAKKMADLVDEFNKTGLI